MTEFGDTLVCRKPNCYRRSLPLAFVRKESKLSGLRCCSMDPISKTGIAADFPIRSAALRCCHLVVISTPVLNREIVPADIIVRSKIVDGTGELDLALLDHIGALRDQTGEMHILL